MADQVPFLESVVLEDPHGYEQVGGHRAVEVDVAQLRRSHPVEGNHHNAQALGAVAEVAARGGKERHRGLLACVEVDCCVVCSFQDDHIGLRQAEVRMGRLAFHLEQHLRVLHFE